MPEERRLRLGLAGVNRLSLWPLRWPFQDETRTGTDTDFFCIFLVFFVGWRRKFRASCITVNAL